MFDYEDGFIAGRNTRPGSSSYESGKVVGGALGLGLAGIFRLVPLAGRVAGQGLVAAPALVLGLRAAALVPALGPGLPDARLLVGGALAIGCFLGLYWLKGATLALRRQGGPWVLPCLLCLGLGCLLPALLLHPVMTRAFPAPGLTLFTWVVPAALAGYAYAQLRPARDYAPRLALRAYRLGYRTYRK